MATTKPDFVEHFPYQDGLLVSYWDTSQSDNNTSTHPGEGLILPVDANPRPLVAAGRHAVAAPGGGYDAPFSLEKSDSFTLHVNGRRQLHPGPGGAAAVPRQRVVLGRLAAHREREGAEHRHQHQGAQPERHLDGDPGLQAQLTGSS